MGNVSAIVLSLLGSLFINIYLLPNREQKQASL
jgi:hypothetical protein